MLLSLGSGTGLVSRRPIVTTQAGRAQPPARVSERAGEVRGNGASNTPKPASKTDPRILVRDATTFGVGHENACGAGLLLNPQAATITIESRKQRKRESRLRRRGPCARPSTGPKLPLRFHLFADVGPKIVHPRERRALSY